MEKLAADAGAAPETEQGRRRFLMRYLRPQMGAALVLWRVEAYSATPLALLFIATLGRWPAALAMGSLMAVFAAVFLFLLEDDPAVDDIRAWADRRRMGRLVERLAERTGVVGRARRLAALVPAIMVLGPFWRAVTFHLFRMRRAPAYVLSVGGSFPHALLWTGLVLGGIWEELLWPWLKGL
jgi:hypothetical protein